MSRDFTWSPTQKKAARAAFDLAVARELKAIRQHVEAMLTSDAEDRVIWKLEEYLYEKRRELDQKYDYRYSMLMLVFPRLVREGWLTLDELDGIGEEKIEVFRSSTTSAENNPSLSPISWARLRLVSLPLGRFPDRPAAEV
jgi:hypothetical protein